MWTDIITSISMATATHFFVCVVPGTSFSISTRLLFTAVLLGPRSEEFSTNKTDEGVGDDDDDERKEGRGENSTHDDRRSEEAHNFFAVLRYSISISHEKDGN